MTRGAAFVLLGSVAVVGAYFLLRPQSDNATDSADNTGDFLTMAKDEIVKAAQSLWEVPANGLKYLPAINAAASTYNVPSALLARLLYQESRFRDDIISGKVTSPVGAIGIAQFMPATAAELKVNPYDAFSSIDGAARYLRKLYNSLGSWDKALAAYNWGIGNVSRKGLSAAPAETQNYVNQILSDVGAQIGLV